MSTRRGLNKNAKRETSKDDNTIGKTDEKLKKSIYSVSTPRNFVQKSSAADIYSRKNDAANVKAPKKAPVPSKIRSNVPPMKDLLKSSSSSISQISTRSYRANKTDNDVKATSSSARFTDKLKTTPTSSRYTSTAKKLPFTNVTVNSPIAKKKSNVHDTVMHDAKSKDVTEIKENVLKKVLLTERKRTRTRTLDEEEIKILTPDVVDNNLEMLYLTNKLNAQPKAFYIDLNEEKPKELYKTERLSDKDVSYEDDFESYESDFDSYKSESKSDHTSSSEDDLNNQYDKHDLIDINVQIDDEDTHSKEERMLDSGNFDLRDHRSIKSKPMEFIVEGSEEIDKKVSLTDEGFQEMSSSSGLSSMKTLHIDILERPLFIDFTKSKENKRKRKIFDRLKQRANEILSMVTLHTMSYDLFEMKPIPYDLYMATFGRFNYTQTAVQTFDDGMTEEVQTDEILVTNKWTQYPTEFSNNYSYETDDGINKKKDNNLEKFSYLINNVEDKTIHNIDVNYRNNPLRIYLEQKEGAGSDTILPYDSYKSKLKNDAYDVKKLRKFLKRVESRISSTLCRNSGNILSNLMKSVKFPFSNEYMSISTRNAPTDMSFLNNSQIYSAIFSETKTNLIITVHDKLSNSFGLKKCILCLWDLGIAILKPLKILIATDNVQIGRFKGSTDGFFVGALCDGTVHLWDLSEEATWYNDIFNKDKSTKNTSVESASNIAKNVDKTNKENNNPIEVEKYEKLGSELQVLQACAYTTSALNMCNNIAADKIVGLEFMAECRQNLDYGRKILARVCSLQRIGILTIWSIIQDKTKNLKPDMGKALWSKIKLEKNQSINLMEHIDFPIHDIELKNSNFNLNSAKKRMSKKRGERNRNKISRPKSGISKCQDDSTNDSNRKYLLQSTDFWEHCVVCNHLKIMNVNVENILIAKNCGEVLCCKRNVGAAKVKTFNLGNPASNVTCIEASPHNLPYFLAATDCGTVNMCSLLDFRVLLTLDCRNGPSSTMDRCQADHKGRYLGSVTVKNTNVDNVTDAKLPVSTVSWLYSNPFIITATFNSSIIVWELTYSDIRAKCRSEGLATATNERTLALLTKEGDIQVYKLTDAKENYLDLFEKYVSLL